MTPTKLLLGILLLCCSITAGAQWTPAANLTVFSEDGHRFYLVLNGERYNDVPQTHVRIEGLPNPYYSCKILFEDRNLPALSKSRLLTADVDGKLQDVTYRIKRDNKGRNVLRFYSFTPLLPEMPRPAGCAVYRFGAPNILVTAAVPARELPGMNIEINDGDGRPDYRGSDRYRYDEERNAGNNDRRGDRRCATAMSNSRFEEAKKSIGGSSFDETRLSSAKQLLSGNCLSASQVAALCGVFSFEESRLDFVKYAYSYCTDPQNYFRVSNVFTFESSKTELNSYVQSHRR